MDKNRKITVADLSPELINQLQIKFDAIPAVAELHAHQDLLRRSGQMVNAYKLGQEIFKVWRKFLTSYVDEVNEQAETIDIHEVGFSKEELNQINTLTLSLFMCCDIIDSCIRDINSTLAKKDESLRFEAFDEINDLAKEVKGKLSILSKQTSFMDKDDPEWGDTVDNMYQMMQNKAKSLIRKKGDSLVKK